MNDIMDRYFFNPFTFLMLLIFVGALFLLFPLFLLSVIGTAFVKLGFSWREVIGILLCTLIGSFVNIPLFSIEGKPTLLKEPVHTLFGFFYRIREYTPVTMVSINVGGAVIPVLISAYLLVDSLIVLKNPWLVILSSLIGIVIVTIVVKAVARPVRGVGIVTPFFVPPLSALLCGVLLSLSPGSEPLASAIIAYVSGTMGTLIGADILNISRIQEISAPVVSIGGAGTFDGIFLTGVIAAFLA
ncbi:MAG: DUF1614 domain-containing protein [Methanomicrobiales archaeon]|nr:DUF1614 domain-containing protein [Methanomicrobiales archaeon]